MDLSALSYTDLFSYGGLIFVVLRVILHDSRPTFGPDDEKRNHFLRWRTGCFYVPWLACVATNNPAVLQCFIYMLCAVGIGEYCHIISPQRNQGSAPVQGRREALESGADEATGVRTSSSSLVGSKPDAVPYKLNKMDRTVQVFGLIFCFALMRSLTTFVVVVAMSFVVFLCGVLLKIIHSGKPLTPDMFNLLACYWLGLFWIAFPLAHTPLLVNGVYVNGVRYGGILFLLMLLTSWIGDAAAYYVGKNFGRHRAMPNVSPNKSVEGCLGLIGFSLLWSAALWWLAVSNTLPILPPFPLFTYLIIGFISSFFGIFGDAIESFVKRIGGVKDSGTFFPGHGGVLDRFDAMFVSGLPLCYYVLIFVVEEIPL